MVSGIYSILNKIDGKIYIGQSIDVDIRWKQHITDLNKNIHFNSYLQNSWNKYGSDAFEFKLLMACKPRYLNRFERVQIKKFDSTNREKGYNLTDGGDSDYTFSDETRKKMSETRKGLFVGENHPLYGKHPSNKTRKKMSESHKGLFVGENHPLYGKHHSDETRKKISKKVKGENHPLYGKHHSDETRKKMSATKKGKKLSDETIKKIIKGNKGKTRSQKSKLNISKGMNTTGFFRVDKKKCKECKQGFYWRYSFLDENNKRKSIARVDIDKLKEAVLEKGLEWKEIKEENDY